MVMSRMYSKQSFSLPFSLVSGESLKLSTMVKIEMLPFMNNPSASTSLLTTVIGTYCFTIDKGATAVVNDIVLLWLLLVVIYVCESGSRQTTVEFIGNGCYCALDIVVAVQHLFLIPARRIR